MPPPEAHITVDGDPVPKGRPRFSRTSSGFVRTYTPERTAEYEARIARAANGTTPFTEAVSVTLTFYLKRPKSLKGDSPVPHTKRPDLDNLVKAALDGLKDYLADDALVCSLSASKFYCSPSQNPHTTITIKGLTP